MHKNKLLMLASFALAALTGQAQILVGQSAGFSGPAAASVKEITEGAKLYIDAINAKGGIAGQKLELISLDDQLDPRQSVENTRKLIEEHKVVALFMHRATPNTEAVIPLLDKYGVPLIAPSTGAMSLHEPLKKHVFNVRATYQREAEKAVTQLANSGVKRIALVFVDDSFGHDALTGAIKGLASVRLAPVLLEKFDRNQPDFSKIVPTVMQASAQAVLIVGAHSAVVDCIKALRTAGSSAQLVTLSNNASGSFIKNLGPHARGVIVTQAFPQSPSYGFVKEAQDLARAKGLDEVTPAMLEGYAGAKVLVEAVRRAGPKPSRARVLAALESMSDFDIGGLQVGFSPQDHTGLNFADLTVIDENGRFRR